MRSAVDQTGPVCRNHAEQGLPRKHLIGLQRAAKCVAQLSLAVRRKFRVKRYRLNVSSSSPRNSRRLISDIYVSRAFYQTGVYDRRQSGQCLVSVEVKLRSSQTNWPLKGAAGMEQFHRLKKRPNYLSLASLPPTTPSQIGSIGD